MPFCPDCNGILIFCRETEDGDLWWCPKENRLGIAVYAKEVRR